MVSSWLVHVRDPDESQPVSGLDPIDPQTVSVPNLVQDSRSLWPVPVKDPGVDGRQCFF